jgi:carbohydrate-selective porin OprB
MRFSLLALCLAAGLTTGCSRKSDTAMSAASGPAFDPVAFFDGHTHSGGVIESRSGAPTAWIVTDGHGVKDDAGRLRMVQRLSFQDGTTQERFWLMWRSGPNRFEATANDMVGTATGEVNGRMFHWQWVLARAPGNKLMDVTMEQWMYRMENGSALIRTTVSKLGFIVAEVTEQFNQG